MKVYGTRKRPQGPMLLGFLLLERLGPLDRYDERRDRVLERIDRVASRIEIENLDGPAIDALLAQEFPELGCWNETNHKSQPPMATMQPRLFGDHNGDPAGVDHCEADTTLPTV